MLVNARGQRKLLQVWLARIDRDGLLQQNLLACLEQHLRRRVCRSGVETKLGGPVRHVQVHGCVKVGLLHAADFAERVPVHRKRPRFVGLKPTVVGLVVGIRSHHDLQVRAIVVGEHVVPPLAGGAVAPGKKLLAGNDVVVRHAHRAGLFAVVVAGDEIVAVVPGENRIRADVVFVPTDVDLLVQVGSAANGVGDRPLGEGVFAMARAVLRSGREDHLVIVVGVHRDVSEGQHGVHHRRAVQDAHRSFEIRFARPQRVAHGPPHALAHFQFPHPNRLAAVGVLLHAVLHGSEGAGAMMMRDVPLHAAGNPRANQADQRGLDDVLPVNEVVIVGLVHTLEDPAAEFRQNAQPDVLVLDVDQRVGLIDLLARQGIVHRIGIDRTLRSLRCAAEEEHRVQLGRPGQVGWDHRLLFPHFDRGRICRESERRGE